MIEGLGCHGASPARKARTDAGALASTSVGWEAWAMAIGIDLGFVALELAQVATVCEKVRKQVALSLIHISEPTRPY